LQVQVGAHAGVVETRGAGYAGAPLGAHALLVLLGLYVVWLEVEGVNGFNYSVV
jgi:hypothetical protein